MTESVIGTKCRILVVEDDPTSASALEKILTRLGYDVEVTRTLAGAEDKLPWSPECVFLDLMLPDGNGLGLLRHVRERDLPINVAVITGASDQALMDEVQSLRPNALFRKPLHLPELMDWLHSASPGPRRAP